MVDITQKFLSNIEVGDNFVKVEIFDKLLKALKTTLEELFATNYFKNSKTIVI